MALTMTVFIAGSLAEGMHWTRSAGFLPYWILSIVLAMSRRRLTLKGSLLTLHYGRLYRREFDLTRLNEIRLTPTSKPVLRLIPHFGRGLKITPEEWQMDPTRFLEDLKARSHRTSFNGTITHAIRQNEVLVWTFWKELRRRILSGYASKANIILFLSFTSVAGRREIETWTLGMYSTMPPPMVWIFMLMAAIIALQLVWHSVAWVFLSPNRLEISRRGILVHPRLGTPFLAPVGSTFTMVGIPSQVCLIGRTGQELGRFLWPEADYALQEFYREATELGLLTFENGEEEDTAMEEGEAHGTC